MTRSVPSRAPDADLARLTQGWGPFRTIVRLHPDRLEFETRGPFGHRITTVGFESVEGTTQGRILPQRFLASWFLLSSVAMLASLGWLAGWPLSGGLAFTCLVGLGLSAAAVRAGWFDVHAFLTTGGRTLPVWSEVPSRRDVEAFFSVAARTRARFLGLDAAAGANSLADTEALGEGTGDGYGEDLDPADEPGESGPEVDGPPGPRWIH